MQLDQLAAYREGVDDPVGIQGARHARKFSEVGEGVGDGILDDLRLIAQVQVVGSPNQVRKAVVHNHAAQAGHEHSQQSGIRLE
jgi:hypothetical protein